MCWLCENGEGKCKGFSFCGADRYSPACPLGVSIFSGALRQGRGVGGAADPRRYGLMPWLCHLLAHPVVGNCLNLSWPQISHL